MLVAVCSEEDARFVRQDSMLQVRSVARSVVGRVLPGQEVGARSIQFEWRSGGRSGVVRCGVVWSGVVWSGFEWSGVEWSGVEWSGVEWSGVVWCGVVWSGVVR